MNRLIIYTIHFIFLFIPFFLKGQTHEITFCNERIPVERNFVSQKLMGVIKSQISQVNMPALKKRAEKYLPIVAEWLEKAGLPEDFKYLPIIESGFLNATSRVGAQGMWQIMKETALGFGATVNSDVDDRNNFSKSTLMACKLLTDNYNYLRKKYNIKSWSLTAAAYNFGMGNIERNIKKQGSDYFTMQLNDETASYVYKIIAVKELFEYPELYMKDFGYNIFTANAKKASVNSKKEEIENSFESLILKVNGKDGNHPDELNADLENSRYTASSSKRKSNDEQTNVYNLLKAKIIGKYSNFTDGQIVEIELEDDLQFNNRFMSKGTKIGGNGWLIDGRLFVDLGFDHAVIINDLDGKRGIALSSLKNKYPISLKVLKEIN